MDQRTYPGGHGEQRTPNHPPGQQQRPNLPMSGSIPRRTLPPLQQPPIPPQGGHHVVPGQMQMGPPAGHRPTPLPHPYPPQQLQAYASYPPPPASSRLPAPKSLATAQVPRKKPSSAPRRHLPTAASRATGRPESSPRESPSFLSIKSETPFVIRVKKVRTIPMTNGGLPRMRLSGRTPKRKRPTYEELRDTDSDDFLTSDDNDDDELRTSKRAQLQHLRAGAKSAATPADVSSSSAVGTTAEDVVMSDVVLDDLEGDSPPPGTLSTLWYSREFFLSTYVLEKIIGWKSRPVVKLEWQDPNDIKMLDPDEASSIRYKILADGEFWSNRLKRMEVSRIHPTQCPVVLVAAATKERKKEQPRYSLAPRKEDEREDVLLVKWRGRSHMHCSWERQKDLEKFDPSNNTARNKIRRYFQAQEIAMGMDWKKIVESERAANADPVDGQGQDDVIEEEEFYPLQYLEVERILACDENDLDLNLLARQRALNLRAEREEIRRREEEEAKQQARGQAGETIHHTHKAHRLLDDLPEITDGDAPWDPEDNVRYVVKWKGLQYAEITWEYWRDIKRDAVDEAEDFWDRNKAPSETEITKIIGRRHPHVRDFRKLTVSPEFAVSCRPRPVADLGDGFTAETKVDEDDKESTEGFKLRSYQLEGVNWLLWNYFNNRSCILADEMGLGKTIQSVAFLHQLHQMPTTQVRGPFLIVAPLSLIGQWQSESQTWAPDFNVVFYHGSADARDFLVNQEFYYTEQFVPKSTALKLKKKHITKLHILITTYEVVLKDIEVLSKIRWKALIVDEAHRLKNPKARLFEELMRVPRDFCVLLTGTPLQNSTEELWALLNFSDPKTFASRDSFTEKFGQLTDAKQVSDLHAMLKPYLLRRVKEDVEKSLPPKEETILEVSLTPVQKTFYKAIYEKNTSFLFKGAKPSNAPSLMNVMMELRKCCNHPFLIRGTEERILNEAASDLKGRKDEHGNVIPVDYLKLFGDQLVNCSGKMVLLAKLLPKLFSGGHKVLIFSQMVRVLDLLEELLKIQKYKYERLDGATSASSRAGAVDRFHRKSCQRFVMLLSTRAGGLGLNLTAADVVIIFDSDWNPQNDLQAMARAHRIGQTRAVSVYRLLTAKTYEMHMFHSASLKLGLDRAVLAHQRQQETEEAQEVKSKTKSEREVQAKEIDALLKKGAYDVFRDEDDTEAKQFLESDIDQLLERSAKKVTYGDTAASSLSSGLGSFSKASFVADTGDGDKDVDLDDPDFWEKAVGLAIPVETPEEIAAMIDDGVKRSRKQVQQFDPYSAFVDTEDKKKEKAERKAREEKEEKERLRALKKAKKLEEKEMKKREKEESKGRIVLKSSRPVLKGVAPVKGDKVKTGEGPKHSKKLKRAERKRALRRAENEDPVMERLKQAWEVPQRNRATSAALRFGFGRFCKMRGEASLTSLPLQDLEVFFRSYVYQLSLQSAVTLLAWQQSRSATGEMQIRPLLQKWLGCQSAGDLEWICDSIQSVVQMQMEVENHRRSLRVPSILAEPGYLNRLRHGAALRALRRICVLNRLNSIVENALDEILSDMGHEELGRRGCLAKDLSTLDADLKVRFVTTEELTLALSSCLRYSRAERRDPCIWWDRSCDVGLLIGTFVHGFGNYESMRNDDDLPFATKISEAADMNETSASAQTLFLAAAKTAKTVFENALDSNKAKEQEKVSAVVAATLAAKSGADDTKTQSDTPEFFFPEEGGADDSHLVTLTRLSKAMARTVRGDDEDFSSPTSTEACSELLASNEKGDATEANEKENVPLPQRLPMPDARLLDRLLVQLISQIEGDLEPGAPNASNGSSDSGWEATKDVIVHEEARSRALSTILGMSKEQVDKELCDFSGIGFSGVQCATTHRSLDDGSEYCVGAATTDLSHVSTGPEAPRYLRARGVPMNITRFAINALVYADNKTLQTMISIERSRGKSIESESIVGEEKQENATCTPRASMETDENSPKPPAQPNSDEEKKSAGSSTESPPAKADEAPTQVPPENSTETPPSKADEAPKQIPPQHPEIAPAFRDNASLRAGLCISALHYGFTTVADDVVVDAAIWSELQRHNPSSDRIPVASMFTLNKFCASAASTMNAIQMPDSDTVCHYIETVFLPHCLRLCVMGNGPTTRNARGSRGKVETACGISQYPDYTDKRQTPLPDPCALRQEHSVEAVASASAILRRTQMLRAVQYIVGGGVSFGELIQMLQSNAIHGSMNDLPVWWCPEIHDLGLLVYAASRGIFSIVGNRKDGIFSQEAIERHLQTTQFAFKQAKDAAWIEEQSQQFPSVNAMERRLGLVCSQLTAHLGNDDARYDHLPMFDHGGWPRN